MPRALSWAWPCGGSRAPATAADQAAQELWGPDADAHTLVERGRAGDEAACVRLAEIGGYLGAAIGSLVERLRPGGRPRRRRLRRARPASSFSGLPRTRPAGRRSSPPTRAFASSPPSSGPRRVSSEPGSWVSARSTEPGSRAAGGLRHADRQPRRCHAPGSGRAGRRGSRPLRGHAPLPHPARASRHRCTAPELSPPQRGRPGRKRSCPGCGGESGWHSCPMRACPGSTTRVRGWSRRRCPKGCPSRCCRGRRLSRLHSLRVGSSPSATSFSGISPDARVSSRALAEELAGWSHPVVAFESARRLPRSLAAARAGDARSSGCSLSRADEALRGGRGRNASASSPSASPSPRRARSRWSSAWAASSRGAASRTTPSGPSRSSSQPESRAVRR